MKAVLRCLVNSFILFFVGCSVQANSSYVTLEKPNTLSIHDTLKSSVKKGVSFANISTGMTLAEIKTVYPKAVFTNVNADKYGDDCHNYGTGYEISLDSQLLMFVVFKDEVCTLLYGISEQYTIGDLNTGMTIVQVMKLFPNAQLKMDILNEMEYISIPKLFITLYFATDETNRAGIYTDPEDPATKIIRADTKISFIAID